MLSHLSPGQLYVLLLRVRDWNTNARTAPVAQRILHLVLKSYPINTFVEMARHPPNHQHGGVDAGADASISPAGGRAGLANGTGNGVGVGGGGAGMADLLRALQTYTERHLRRVEELVDQSFLLEERRQ